MRHALQGGKRLRAFLVLEGARLHGVEAGAAIWPACGIEAMHAYSLVHDDLPCMDDDAERRGQPTVHVKWDEMTAVLTGDALQALAFELVTHASTGSAAIRAELALSLARAAGGQGMVMGQALDMAAERARAPLSLEQITALQAGKTGALFEWSAAAGARMAGADPAPLIRYAAAMGQAFQIHDDVIDVTGDAAAAGKAVGKDAAAGKATFVSLLGLEGARARAAELVDAACDALSVYGAAAATLQQTARFAISRHS
ncbi:farnesyl-diphosphate synthase [Pelagivirga sediminicola]|uniref:Geranylgeranyl diphosphate synthase n=2 Tax=Pelagivirga sediminicola TaxID=2170575 RepID=A0A2T7GCA5_9RHOB|nr:farnesyl-diphosphate synthase [Pelagivirga sediminicola]